MLWVYGAWIVFELVRIAIGKQRIRAFETLARVWKARKR
jgi:hypothetical protein